MSVLDRLLTSAFFAIAGCMVGFGAAAAMLCGEPLGWAVAACAAFPAWRGVVWTRREAQGCEP